MGGLRRLDGVFNSSVFARPLVLGRYCIVHHQFLAVEALNHRAMIVLTIVVSLNMLEGRNVVVDRADGGFSIDE